MPPWSRVNRKRASDGKAETTKVESAAESVRATAAPPATGTASTLKMPVLLEEKSSCFSSAVNDAPLIETVSMNCSIVYCFEGRWIGRAGEGRGGEEEQDDGRRTEVEEHVSSRPPLSGTQPPDKVQPARVPSGTGRSGTASAGAIPSA